MNVLMSILLISILILVIKCFISNKTKEGFKSRSKCGKQIKGGYDLAMAQCNSPIASHCCDNVGKCFDMCDTYIEIFKGTLKPEKGWIYCTKDPTRNNTLPLPGWERSKKATGWATGLKGDALTWRKKARNDFAAQVSTDECKMAHDALRAAAAAPAPAVAAVASSTGLTDSQARSYLAKYPDLQNAFGSDLEQAKSHWISNGKGEGRTWESAGAPGASSTGLTDSQARSYLAKYPDLQNAFGSDLEQAKSHWISNGKGEGRTWESAGAPGASSTELTNSEAQCWRKMPQACDNNLSEAGSGGTGVVWFVDPGSKTTSACDARIGAFNNYCIPGQIVSAANGVETHWGTRQNLPKVQLESSTEGTAVVPPKELTNSEAQSYFGSTPDASSTGLSPNDCSCNDEIIKKNIKDIMSKSQEKLKINIKSGIFTCVASNGITPATCPWDK